VTTKLAPAPIGPYSQGVISGGFLFCSGQVALDEQLVHRFYVVNERACGEACFASYRSNCDAVNSTLFNRSVGGSQKGLATFFVVDSLRHFILHFVG
jgi:hypothetical protein